MQAKTPEQSKTIMTDLVLPSETNPLNNLFGGELFQVLYPVFQKYPVIMVSEYVGAELFQCGSILFFGSLCQEALLW